MGKLPEKQNRKKRKRFERQRPHFMAIAWMYREDGMRDQNGKVDRPNPTLPGKPRKADYAVVGHIQYEKETRYNRGGDHTLLVCADPSLTDKEKPCDEQDGAGPIESGVDSGKVGFGRSTLPF